MNSDANNKNTINPKHLLHSKWTATEPKNQEQHFIVTRTVLNKKGQVSQCTLQAIKTQRDFMLDWKQLKDRKLWLPGWV